MKLLFDENLIRKLVQRLADLFPGSKHVDSEDQLRAPDARVWEYARAKGFTIITADLKAS